MDTDDNIMFDYLIISLAGHTIISRDMKVLSDAYATKTGEIRKRFVSLFKGVTM